VKEKKLPTLKALKKRNNELKDSFISRGLAGNHLVGRNREIAIDLIMRFVHEAGDFEPGIEEYGDASRVDSEFVHEEFYIRRKRSVELLLIPFEGLKLDTDKLRELCIVVSGRYDELRAAEPIKWWGGDQVVETLLFVHEVRRKPAKGRRYYVEFEAFTGVPAGTKWSSELTGGRIQQMIRETGVAKFKKYRDDDISGMYFIAKLQFVEARLVFHEIRFDHCHQDYNRRLLQARAKICTGPCAYMRGKTCAPCPVARDSCPRSRFSKAFDRDGDCRNGHVGLMQSASDVYCFSCLMKGLFHEEHLGSKY